ncbi:hypothetical protein FRAHR75_1100016 [Frankia sp. Hr75.2]|nr:hypothetical protein FRAHR75_1100016 [Frankia sp. Hr75.2]
MEADPYPASYIATVQRNVREIGQPPGVDVNELVICPASARGSSGTSPRPRPARRVVTTDFDDPGATRGGHECLTPAEAHLLAWMLIRAATTFKAAENREKAVPPRRTTSGDEDGPGQATSALGAP